MANSISGAIFIKQSEEIPFLKWTLDYLLKSMDLIILNKKKTLKLYFAKSLFCKDVKFWKLKLNLIDISSWCNNANFG